MVSDTPLVYALAVSIKFPPRAANRSRILCEPSLSNFPSYQTLLYIFKVLLISAFKSYKSDLKKISKLWTIQILTNKVSSFYLWTAKSHRPEADIGHSQSGLSEVVILHNYRNCFNEYCYPQTWCPCELTVNYVYIYIVVPLMGIAGSPYLIFYLIYGGPFAINIISF